MTMDDEPHDWIGDDDWIDDDDRIDDDDWLDEFPMVETYTDSAGNRREFDVDLFDTPGGYLATARERDREHGYEFQAMAEVRPSRALWTLRTKIRKGLAIRYLERTEFGWDFTHDEAEGHIELDGLVIDGEFIPFEELARMLAVYEGFRLRLQITDASREDP